MVVHTSPAHMESGMGEEIYMKIAPSIPTQYFVSMTEKHITIDSGLDSGYRLCEHSSAWYHVENCDQEYSLWCTTCDTMLCEHAWFVHNRRQAISLWLFTHRRDDWFHIYRGVLEKQQQ